MCCFECERCEMPDLRHSQQKSDLDETDGWMECESCHNAVQVLEYVKTRHIPVYQMADCNLLVPLSKKR